MSTQVATRPVIGVDIALDLSRTAVAVAGRQGKLVKIELEYLAGADNARQVIKMAGRTHQVILSTAGPADTLVHLLKKAGVRVIELSRREAELAENNFAIELFKAQKARVRLPNDPTLKDAVKHARMRRTRAGNLLDKLLSATDLYPYSAAAYAFHGMTRRATRPPKIHVYDPDWVRPAPRKKDED